MAGTSDAGAAPTALHVATDDVPWVDDWLGVPGIRMKVLQADVEGGVFVVRVGFAPGVQLPTHMHTGAVHAYTFSGEWSYLEDRDSPPNRAGSYLYEPPGSTHTLKVADAAGEETDALFVVHGAMVLYDEASGMTDVIDAATHRRDYLRMLEEQGKPAPRIIEGGQARLTGA